VLKVGKPGFDSLAESGQNTLNVSIHSMSVGSGGGGEGRKEPRPPWIFIEGTDKLEGGLMVLFFGLIFTVGSPLKFFLPTLLIHSFLT